VYAKRINTSYVLCSIYLEGLRKTRKFRQETWCPGRDSNRASLSLWLYSPLDLGCFLSFLILYTFGRTPWTGVQPIARPLPAHRTIQTQNKRTQTSMPRVAFEPTNPVFERAKTVHALDRAVTVIGRTGNLQKNNVMN
jgi:hypothetical protein